MKYLHRAKWEQRDGHYGGLYWSHYFTEQSFLTPEIDLALSWGDGKDLNKYSRIIQKPGVPLPWSGTHFLSKQISKTYTWLRFIPRCTDVTVKAFY